MTCALYRHFDADDQILYIGITNNPKRRLAEHKCRSVWADQIDRVDVKWMHSREGALDAEVDAIATESPLFNGGGFHPAAPTGDVLRDWMKDSSITQADLADAYGVSQGTISQMMNGNRSAPLKFAVFIEDLSEGVVPCRYWMFGATVEWHGNSPEAVSLAHLPTPEASA